MTTRLNGRVLAMSTRSIDCSCSILNAREEKLLDDEGRVQVRLICNRCGTVLDSEVVPYISVHRAAARTQHEAEAAEGS
jgi:hypothetical protein